ncbi:MAG: hypothetical protein ABJD11_04755 [Gemmatimonadota bacterium]
MPEATSIWEHGSDRAEPGFISVPPAAVPADVAVVGGLEVSTVLDDDVPVEGAIAPYAAAGVGIFPLLAEGEGTVAP